MDAVIISPEPGRAKEIGQTLLGLAEHPYDVQWVTWPQAGYAIALELFQKFSALQDEAAEEPKEAPKRRGRQRKEASTDNDTPEEE